MVATRLVGCCSLLSFAAAFGQGYVPWNDESDYTTQTIAGSSIGTDDGAGTDARFRSPVALALDEVYSVLYVADRGNHRIRALNLTGYEVTTVAGSTDGYSDGASDSAQFSEPSGLALDAYGQVLFIADTANNLIRRLDLATGVVSTLAGSLEGGFIDGRAQAAAFRYPLGLAFFGEARQLFVCDSHNHAIRVVHVDTREVRTLAGVDAPGTADGNGAAARFILPQSVSLDAEEVGKQRIDIT